MVSETPNHKLNKYQQGETNWDHSDDMATIEKRLVITDVEANRSNYEPHEDATFRATDTGAVYDGDGSAWNKATREYESVSAEQAFTKRILQRSASNPDADLNSKQGELVESQAYGEAGGTVYLEAPNTYLVDSVVDIKDGIQIVGSSPRAAELKAADSYTGETILHAHPTTRTYFSGAQWLRIDGNRANATTKGLVTDDDEGGEPSDMHIEHLIIRDTAEEGLKLDYVWGYRVNQMLVEGCGSGTNYAVHINGQGTGKEQIHANQWFVAFNESDWAMYVESPTGEQKQVYQDIWVQANHYGGLRVDTPLTTWVSPQIEGNADADAGNHDGMYVGGNRTRISDGMFDGRGNERFGLRLRANSCKLQNCDFQGHQSASLEIGGNNNIIVGGQFPDGIDIATGQDNQLWAISPDTALTRTDGTRTMLNGRYIDPPVHDLAGTNQSISPVENPVFEYDLRVDAGGTANTAVEGIDTIATDGTVVNLIHTGGEAVDLAHNSGNATNPLVNKSSAADTLANNGDMATYRYDSNRSRWVQKIAP